MKFDLDRAATHLAFVGLIAVIGGIVELVHQHGRFSVIDDIYHKHGGWVVIPGKTDEQGNWKEDVE